MMQRFLPGLLLSLGIALLAQLAAHYVQGPGSICFAILIGIAAGNLLPYDAFTQAGVALAEKRILPIAIALMGTELELHTLGTLGLSALFIVLPAMGASILAAVVMGRGLGISTEASLILGIGNSVCGSSAVLASAPAVKAEKHDVAAAIAAVNLAGTLGMFALPAMATALSLSPLKSAYLIGGSLQAVGQVIAAGFSMPGHVGHNALVIKMLRVLMIGPIVMVLHGIFRTGRSAESGGREFYVPGYIIGFILCATAAGVFHDDKLILPHVETLAKLLLTIAMAAVGCRINLRSLMAQGPRALLLVGILTAIQTSVILALISVFV